MLTTRPVQIIALVAAGLMSVPAVGCSTESERSGEARIDTLGVVQKPETTTTAPAAPHKPVGHPVKKLKAGVRPAPVASKAPAHAAPAAAPATAPAQPVAPAVADADTTPKWLSYDAATNTVTFELIAGPFDFNGYRNGEGTLVVPPKANIVMNFVNKDGTPHSAIVISGEGPIPNAASDPAIPRAYTNKVLEGLPQEAGDVMRFPVPESGTYRIFCGVPGHGLSGMWIWLRIDPATKAPSFGPTKA